MDLEELPGGRSLQHRQSSSAFGGLLGKSDGRRRSLEMAGDLAGAARLCSLPNVAVTLHYDEDDFPSLELDLHVFVFDKSGEYLDCICYRNREMPGLSNNGKSLFISWSELPTNCSVFVLSVAAYTLGTSIGDLTDSFVTVSTADPAFPARKLIQFDLATTEATGPALFYGIIAEIDDQWFIKSCNVPGESHTPDLLIKGAKEIAADFVIKRVSDKLIDLVSVKEEVASHGDVGGMSSIGATVAEKTEATPAESSNGHALNYAKKFGRAVLPEMGEMSELQKRLQEKRGAPQAEPIIPAKPEQRSQFAGVSDAELRAKLQARRTASGGNDTPPGQSASSNRGIPKTVSLGRSQGGEGPPLVRSSTTMIQTLSTLELSLSSIEIGMEQLRVSQQPSRDSLEKLEDGQSSLKREHKLSVTRLEGRIQGLESQMGVLNEKLDILITCFKESGYIE